MTWVYLLTSIPFPDRTYIGLTEHLENRLDQHNSGAETGFTSKYNLEDHGGDSLCKS